MTYGKPEQGSRPMMKRILSIILTLVMIVTFLPASTSFAAETNEMTVTYEVLESGKCGDNVTWEYRQVIKNGGTWITMYYDLLISGTGDMEDYDNIGHNPPWYTKEFWEVVVEEGVTSIGAWAFSNQESLTNISLPDSLEKIKTHAFWNCTELIEVELPENLNTLEDYAFYSCSSLRSINIPKKLTKIAQNTFQACKSLKEITLHDSITSIENEAFKYCTSVKKVIIPDSVKSIGYYAFSYMKSLTDLKLSKNLKSLEHYAFVDCTSLTFVEVPGKITLSEENAFRGCSSVANIVLDPGFTSVASNTFTACSGLKNVYLPASLDSIGSGAFSSCKAISDVYYTGTKSGFDEIIISSGNAYLQDATIHYLKANESAVMSLDQSGNKIEIIFTPAEKATKYQIQRKAKDGSWENVTTSATEIRYFDTKPLMGKVTYRVRPYINGQWGSYGETKTISYNPFSDVKTTDGYFDKLAWAYNEGIIGGYKDGTFRPNNTCTRANFTIMLWKYAGQPDPGSISNPFSDVSKSLGENQYKSIMWAYKKGIVSGYSDGTFKPNGNLTRGQIIIMLWKYAGQPDPGSVTNPFTDVSEAKLGKNQYKAIMWAYKNSIVKGTNSTSFSPGSACKRSQIVTILYNYDNTK